MIAKIFSLCLCPLIFFSARITTILFLGFGLLGWIEGFRHKKNLIPTSLSLPFFALLVLFFYSPQIALYILMGLGIRFLNLKNTNYLTAGVILTLVLLFLDAHHLLFLKLSRYGSRLHTAPCLAIALAIWVCFDSLIKKKHYYRLAAFYGFAFITLKKCDCDTAFLAFLAGSFALLFYNKPKRAKKISLSYLVFFLLPFVLRLSILDIEAINKKHLFGFSYIHRLYILKDVCESIREAKLSNFLFGYGVNHAKKTREQKDFWTFYEKNNTIALIPKVYFHPHNIPLQIWQDLGMLGVVLFFLLFYFLPVQNFLQTAWLASACVISLVSVGLFEWWWMGLCFLTYGLCAQQKES
jgi:O-antigen ligase